MAKVITDVRCLWQFLAGLGAESLDSRSASAAPCVGPCSLQNPSSEFLSHASPGSMLLYSLPVRDSRGHVGYNRHYAQEDLLWLEEITLS